MAYIEIELDDFETIELIEKLTKRLHKNKRTFLTGKNLKKAVEMMSDLSSAICFGSSRCHS